EGEGGDQGGIDPARERYYGATPFADSGDDFVDRVPWTEPRRRGRHLPRSTVLRALPFPSRSQDSARRPRVPGNFELSGSVTTPHRVGAISLQGGSVPDDDAGGPRGEPVDASAGRWAGPLRSALELRPAGEHSRRYDRLRHRDVPAGDGRLLGREPVPPRGAHRP